jgi:coproporphyrinogen III oxidase
MQPSKSAIEQHFRTLQRDICEALEVADGGAPFEQDAWQRPGGGGGLSRVLTGGRIIEKGGVNFSAVHGNTPEKIQKALGLTETDFFATGVSIVLHPHSPHVPIIHMNVRYFEMSGGTWWFGGGIDLTPHYVDVHDAQYFHQALKMVCDAHHHSFYPKFKQWADDYFFVKHRNETRGIGGIFFDRLNESTADLSKEKLFEFVMDVGRCFAPTYTALMLKSHAKPYQQHEKQWQLYRRGRYVEFNLVLDKGTKFGLDTEGRTESILMSLPPLAAWSYNHQTAAGSAEAYTLQHLKKNIDWINYHHAGSAT